MIEKHRNGATGQCELYFDEKKTSFVNLDTHYEEPVGAGDDDSFDNF